MAEHGTFDPLPYYKWHWLRYRASRKVQRMGVLERGIYRELLDEQWVEGCVRGDSESLKEILEDAEQVITIAKQVLGKCFTEISPGLWQNSTLEEQRTEKDLIRSKRKIAGSLGGKAKLQSEANAKQMQASASKCHIEREREEREEREKLLSETSSDGIALVEMKRKDDPKIPIQRVFEYYREKIGRSAAYVLTEKRLRQGSARFKEASILAPKLKPELPIADIPDAAEKLMKYAIDRLADSDYHMGRQSNSQGTCYNDWENLFRSTEQFSKWMEKFQCKTTNA